MTDLLLITDVPRLRKVFSKLNDSGNLRLRIASNLEKGAEELVAEKPGIVFVQTHLSGLSPDIILMHLKKQLGRKRSRFVLLAAADQVGSETLKLYQGSIDTSLEDTPLLYSIRDTINALTAKPAKKTEPEIVPVAAAGSELHIHQEESEAETVPAVVPTHQEQPAPTPHPPEELSLVEQGVTYAPRPRMSVYSEFNSSFDSAVDSMKPTTLDNVAADQHHDWNRADIETIETPPARSKSASFVLWLAPVLIAVVVVTFLQQKRTSAPSVPETKKTTIAATSGTAPVPAPVPAPAPVSVPVSVPVPVTASVIAKPQPAAAAAPLQAQPTNPADVKKTSAPDAALSDKAVISAIAENRGKKESTSPPVNAGRPTVLPDFIPRYAVDKSYAQANPGWERYKGQVTEFKVFRETGAIKAIQVIDKGGNGVPESFMKAAVRQVSKNPAVVMEASEKKEGYEIQRGQTADGLKVMYYRDDQGGKLRAFVLTWK